MHGNTYISRSQSMHDRINLEYYKNCHYLGMHTIVGIKLSLLKSSRCR
jgi:hypothetical protein